VWLRYGNEWKSLGTLLHSARGILGRKCSTGVNVRMVCESCIVSYHMLSHLHALDWSLSVGTWQEFRISAARVLAMMSYSEYSAYKF